eukprot:6195920-Pleurochrysis_carterae.AAC.3
MLAQHAPNPAFHEATPPPPPAARLVLRGREVDAALEHAPVPLGKLLRIALGGVGEALHRSLGEEKAEHARDVTAAQADGSKFSSRLRVLRMHGEDWAG